MALAREPIRFETSPSTPPPPDVAILRRVAVALKEGVHWMATALHPLPVLNFMVCHSVCPLFLGGLPIFPCLMSSTTLRIVNGATLNSAPSAL